jgi:Domain of unknown function (DUF4180)
MTEHPHLAVVEENGIRVVEGRPGQQLMLRSQDINGVLGACLSAGISGALLYRENLTDRFFDVSSAQAGEVLQKLRNYGVRLAVVCSPDTVQFSSRFAELLAAERRDRFFDILALVRPRANGWPGRRQSIRADGIPRSRRCAGPTRVRTSDF